MHRKKLFFQLYFIWVDLLKVTPLSERNKQNNDSDIAWSTAKRHSKLWDPFSKFPLILEQYRDFACAFCPGLLFSQMYHVHCSSAYVHMFSYQKSFLSCTKIIVLMLNLNSQCPAYQILKREEWIISNSQQWIFSFKAQYFCTGSNIWSEMACIIMNESLWGR